MALAVLLASAAGAAPIPVDDLPFDLVDNHVWVQVRVNGSEPLEFIFDTGAELSAIDLRRANALGLRSDRAIEAGGAGEGTATESLIPGVHLTVGSTDLGPLTIGAADLSPVTGDRPVDGLLGYDFACRYAIEIDYGQHRLRLYEPRGYRYDGDGARLPIRVSWRSRIPTIRARIEGPDGASAHGRFRLDTGAANALELHSPTVQRVPWIRDLADHALSASNGKGIGGQLHDHVGRVSTLELGPIALRDPLTGFSYDQRGAFASTDVEGNIGNEILRRFDLVLDYAHGQVFLKPNASFGEPMEYDMLGARLERDAATRALAVSRVVEGSAAAEAGLVAGDLVVAIDGRPAPEVTLDEARRLFRTPDRAFRLTVARGDESLEIEVTTRRLV